MPQGIPYGHVPPQQPGYGSYVDPEDPEDVKGFGFTDESIRKGFIRKVYSILMVNFFLNYFFDRVLIFFYIYFSVSCWLL